jgi:hypothetical protein
MLPLNKLDKSPHRDFEVYGIRPEHVERLKDSILTDPAQPHFWVGIMARPHPEKKGSYQISHGHHRIEAAKAAGLKEIPVDVQDLTDDQMLSIMVHENAIQGGQNIQADADSVLAICKQLWRAAVNPPDNCQEGSKHAAPAESRTGMAQKGYAMDPQTILKSSHEAQHLSERRVRTAIEYLQSTKQWPPVYAPQPDFDEDATALSLEVVEVQRTKDQTLNPKAFSVFNLDKPAQGKAFMEAMGKYWTYITLDDQVILAQETFDALKMEDESGGGINGTDITRYIDKKYQQAKNRNVVRRGKTLEARRKQVDDTLTKIKGLILSVVKKIEWISIQSDEVKDVIGASQVAMMRARAKQLDHLNAMVAELAEAWTNLLEEDN